MNRLFNFFGLTRVFEGDGNSDANKPDVDGGNVGPQKAGGGGGDDKDKKQTPPKDQTYEITVDGEKRQVTIDEMRDLAQKSAGANKKFEDASKMRKDAQDGLRLKELVTRLSDGNHEPTEAEVGELAGMMGADPAEFVAYLTGDPDGDMGTGDKEGKLGGEFDRVFAERLGFTPAEAKQRLDFSHSRHIKDALAEIRKISDNEVDKDEFFGKIKIGEKAEDRMSVIRDMVAEDVLGKVQKGDPFGAELVAASIQKVRAYFTKFGIPGKPDLYPLALGLGPSGGIPAEVNSEEPIQRISSADEKGEENFIARYMQRGLKKLREANRR